MSVLRRKVCKSFTRSRDSRRSPKNKFFMAVFTLFTGCGQDESLTSNNVADAGTTDTTQIPCEVPAFQVASNSKPLESFLRNPTETCELAILQFSCEDLCETWSHSKIPGACEPYSYPKIEDSCSPADGRRPFVPLRDSILVKLSDIKINLTKLILMFRGEAHLFSDRDAGARPAHAEVSAGSVRKIINVGSATYCSRDNVSRVQFDPTEVEIDPKGVVVTFKPLDNNSIQLDSVDITPCYTAQ